MTSEDTQKGFSALTAEFEYKTDSISSYPEFSRQEILALSLLAVLTN